MGPGGKSPRYIYQYLLVYGSMAYGIVLLAPWPLPCCGRMGSVVGYGWVAYGFGWDVSSAGFVRFLYFPWLFTVGVGSFLMGWTSVEVFWVHCIQACTLCCSFYP